MLKLLFGPCNDMVLQAFAEVDKIGTVTRDSYNQVGVLFGVFLGILQGCIVHDIKLDVRDTHVAPGSEVADKLVFMLVIHKLGEELLIQELVKGFDFSA
jgi:hypothetical protein